MNRPTTVSGVVDDLIDHFPAGTLHKRVRVIEEDETFGTRRGLELTILIYYLRSPVGKQISDDAIAHGSGDIDEDICRWIVSRLRDRLQHLSSQERDGQRIPGEP